MSSAQIVQLLITVFGIALAMLVFLFGPFELLGNSIAAVVIFILAGTAAGYAYAKLQARRRK
jgi:positive regulator of sigma E activity